jgi:glycosyltransferase involved in cell wall biosynthesis
MFIVPCKYNPLCLIEKTVESIRKLYPTTKILVVDSNSDDKKYAKKLKKYDIIFADIKNVCCHRIGGDLNGGVACLF